MLDARMRRLVDPPLDRAGRRLAASGLRADHVTLAGFAIGLLAVPALADERYGLALAVVLANRLADGLDGAVARAAGPTDFGGYLDIVCDFVLYAAVVLGFALARPENAVAAATLVVAFVGTGTSFLAYAILAAKRGVTTTLRGHKAFYYLGGLTEGTETIAAFVAMCLFPDAFRWIAYGFAAMCALTTLTRVLSARAAFGREAG